MWLPKTLIANVVPDEEGVVAHWTLEIEHTLRCWPERTAVLVEDEGAAIVPAGCVLNADETHFLPEVFFL